MKIVQINMVPNGSTGKIMLQVAETARSHGHQARTYSTDPFHVSKRIYRTDAPEHYIWGSWKENLIHYVLGSTLGANGRFSRRGTKQLLKELDQFAPDIIHLHNLHSFCINLPMLFRYIKRKDIQVVWTLHDCWPFTGKCAYFSAARCDKWLTGCHHCPQLGIYPKSRVDTTKKMYKLKEKWFTGISKMTLVTPSQWLADLVKQSFLKEYPVRVINNGIDLSVFKPVCGVFRAKYHCENKFVLLGVADYWGSRKGLDVFVDLAKRLDDRYQIVLVGTNDNVDKQLPDNIISIHRTDNQQALAEIYAAADLFVNPTREDNYPTVNMEAIACGTPVVTFKTGGSPEMLDENCGSVVACDDADALEMEIKRISAEKPYTQTMCTDRAKSFAMSDRFQEYCDLYDEVMARQ